MHAHPQQGQDPSDVLALRREAGAWLRELRVAAGLSQRQLAEAVGIDYYTFISQIEAGRGRIPPERYEKWAEVVNIDAAELVRGLMQYYDPHTHRILFG